jgi:hypothetical protein
MVWPVLIAMVAQMAAEQKKKQQALKDNYVGAMADRADHYGGNSAEGRMISKIDGINRASNVDYGQVLGMIGRNEPSALKDSAEVPDPSGPPDAGDDMPTTHYNPEDDFDPWGVSRSGRGRR